MSGARYRRQLQASRHYLPGRSDWLTTDRYGLGDR
jgi:hypothetical protein